MLLWEKKVFLKGSSIIIGLDEAGRGPLAGPVVAAAVMLKTTPLRRFAIPFYKERVDDSKKMLPRQREKAFCEISEKSLFVVASKDHKFIDQKNIYKATLSVMKEAVRRLIKKYCQLNNKTENKIRKNICILVDGNMHLDVPYKTISIVKGDSKSLSIAAASIMAKVARDRMMEDYDKKYPSYGFLRHKGYGTKFHLDAIRKYGPCPIHRKTFSPIKKT